MLIYAAKVTSVIVKIQEMLNNSAQQVNTCHMLEQSFQLIVWHVNPVINVQMQVPKLQLIVLQAITVQKALLLHLMLAQQETTAQLMLRWSSHAHTVHLLQVEV